MRGELHDVCTPDPEYGDRAVSGLYLYLNGPGTDAHVRHECISLTSPTGPCYMLGAFVIYYFFGQWGVPLLCSRSSWPCSCWERLALVIERCIYRPNQRWDRTYPGGAHCRHDVCASHGLSCLWHALTSTCRPCFMVCILSLGGISAERLMHYSRGECPRPRLVPVHQQDQDGAAMRAIEQDKEAAALQGSTSMSSTPWPLVWVCPGGGEWRLDGTDLQARPDDG